MRRHGWNRSFLTVFLFAILLGGMFFVSIFTPQKTYSESENRYLKKKPEFSWDSLVDGSFGKDYEEYLSDQFPARDGWIGGKVLAERLSGKRDVNGVYIGRDGYLIERYEAEDIETELLEKNLEKLADFAKGAAAGLGEDHVRVMLVPSASQIMKNRLPWLAAPYNQGNVTEKLADLMDGEASLIVAVEQELARHGDEPLYYKTDHHWTAEGAYYGYRAWAESVGLAPWETEAFDKETVSRDFLGTVYSKLNIPWERDSIEAWMPQTQQTYRVSFDENEKEWDSLYFYDALKKKDQYAFYLDGNHGITRIVNGAAKPGRKDEKLLIIKDSYAHSFAPFAANHYGTVYMADLRYLNMDLGKWMEEKGITDVLVLYQIPGFSREKTVSKLVLS